ncbi:MAG: hypothetical protein G01um10148_898 [Parcubacteria group bacterium Gr01-1014_8]|nr:MAG: hypothetical protein G01um10148_898 [Parcubacteria group bacterium Gr01-1014_8]
MVEQSRPTGEIIKDPGNVIEAPDKVIPNITNRLILEEHDDPVTEQQIGDDVLSFSAESISPLYSDAPRSSMVVMVDRGQRKIHEHMNRHGTSLYFADMHMSPETRAFEQRRMFLKIFLGGGSSIAAMSSSSLTKTARYAAGVAMFWLMGPRVARNVMAYTSSGKHNDFRTLRGKAWKAVSNTQEALNPDEHRFTVGLRNSLISYKHRAATRLALERAGSDTASRNAVLSVGDGHNQISGMLHTKTDEELLETIRRELQRLVKVDPNDDEMWASISNIPEVWFTDGKDPRAQATIPLMGELKVAGGKDFLCSKIHEDSRLSALVREVRNKQ